MRWDRPVLFVCFVFPKMGGGGVFYSVAQTGFSKGVPVQERALLPGWGPSFGRGYFIWSALFFFWEGAIYFMRWYFFSRGWVIRYSLSRCLPTRSPDSSASRVTRSFPSPSSALARCPPLSLSLHSIIMEFMALLKKRNSQWSSWTISDSDSLGRFERYWKQNLMTTWFAEKN